MDAKTATIENKFTSYQGLVIVLLALTLAEQLMNT
jgi:hypothetical protein